MQELIRNLSDVARDAQPSVSAKKPYHVARLCELAIAPHTVLLPLQCTLTPQLPAIDIGRQADELHAPPPQSSSRRASDGAPAVAAAAAAAAVVPAAAAAAETRRPILESKQVFPEDTRIYVARFDEWADVMQSKEKPKRIKVTASNEQKCACSARGRGVVVGFAAAPRWWSVVVRRVFVCASLGSKSR
jgi:hypothetical protein